MIMRAADVADYDHSFEVGIVCLLATFIGNGVHSSFAKLANKDAAPAVYTLYLSLGLFLGCTAVVAIMGQPFQVTWLGLLGGLLLCLSVTCYIRAILLVGMVWTDMLTASSATIVSFLWGKLYLREPSRNASGIAIGLLLLLFGISGISSVLLHRLRNLKRTEGSAELRQLVSGLFLAACAGILGGTCFPVNKLQPPSQQGVTFVWTQALGMLITQLFLVLLAVSHDLCNRTKAKTDEDLADESDCTTPHTIVLGRWQPSSLIHLGVAQSIVLGLTNLTTTIAALSPIGIGVAQPVREAGHSLAVLIGTIIFREYGSLGAQFLTSLLALACVNVAGMVILTIYGIAPR